MAVSTLTDAQKRALQDYIPALSNREPGIDLYTILSNIISLANDNETGGASSIVSGSAEVTSGNADVTVAVGAASDGNPAIAVLAELDGTAALHVRRVVWDGSGNLSIVLSGTTDGDRTVFYMIDNR